MEEIINYREYNLRYIDKELTVINVGHNHLYTEIINTSRNFTPYNWRFGRNSSWVFQNKPNEVNNGLPLGKDSFYYFDRIHVTDKETFYDIYIIINDKYLFRIDPVEHDINSPIVLVTGHSGGGTSIVNKSLKSLGLHIGDDAGSWDNRKAFESIAFRTYLFHIFPNIQNPEILQETLNSAFASYVYKPKEINIIKLADLENNQIALKMSQDFPNIKFISIIKQKSSETRSTEGVKFNDQGEYDIYKQQHPTIEGSPIFHLDWKKYFTDYNYVNKVLKYIGSDIVLNEDTFNLMLKEISFDNSRLS